METIPEFRPTQYEIDKTYRDAVASKIKASHGTVSRVYPNMSPGVIIRDAQYRLFGNGDCD
jgi:hypothetical protein